MRQIETDPLSAWLVVTTLCTGEQCEVDILEEALWYPAAQTDYGPVLAVGDVVGTKVRALADRGLPRDLIDAHAIDAHAEFEAYGLSGRQIGELRRWAQGREADPGLPLAEDRSDWADE